MSSAMQVRRATTAVVALSLPVLTTAVDLKGAAVGAKAPIAKKLRSSRVLKRKSESSAQPQQSPSSGLSSEQGSEQNSGARGSSSGRDSSGRGSSNAPSMPVEGETSQRGGRQDDMWSSLRTGLFDGEETVESGIKGCLRNGVKGRKGGSSSGNEEATRGEEGSTAPAMDSVVVGEEGAPEGRVQPAAADTPAGPTDEEIQNAHDLIAEAAAELKELARESGIRPESLEDAAKEAAAVTENTGTVVEAEAKVNLLPSLVCKGRELNTEALVEQWKTAVSEAVGSAEPLKIMAAIEECKIEATGQVCTEACTSETVRRNLQGATGVVPASMKVSFSVVGSDTATSQETATAAATEDFKTTLKQSCNKNEATVGAGVSDISNMAAVPSNQVDVTQGTAFWTDADQVMNRFTTEINSQLASGTLGSAGGLQDSQSASSAAFDSSRNLVSAVAGVCATTAMALFF